MLVSLQVITTDFLIAHRRRCSPLVHLSSETIRRQQKHFTLTPDATRWRGSGPDGRIASTRELIRDLKRTREGNDFPGALIYAIIYLDLLSSFLSPGHMNLFNLKLLTRLLFCLKYIALIAISPARHCFLMMSVQLFRVCFLDHDREGTARFFIASA